MHIIIVVAPSSKSTSTRYASPPPLPHGLPHPHLLHLPRLLIHPLHHIPRRWLVLVVVFATHSNLLPSFIPSSYQCLIVFNVCASINPLPPSVTELTPHHQLLHFLLLDDDATSSCLAAIILTYHSRLRRITPLPISPLRNPLVISHNKYRALDYQ
jgi:hypothetical protein